METPAATQVYIPKRESIISPPFRRLKGYAFDPSLSIQLETALVNEITFKVLWERPDKLRKGPVGEYVEVVDYDPASGCFYRPVDLDNPLVLAQDGLPPSEGNPYFHQQMVYAVTMTTIRNFERAMGRPVLWSPHRTCKKTDKGIEFEDEYVPRLRIYPHAMRQANAYYSPEKKALLFGYFPASSASAGQAFPGGIVFTCLSHDIVAHETTHALLDGMHRRYIEPTQPDSLAFHEGFADLVALFQHFTFPEVLREQIAKTRGNLASENLLMELASEFGTAIGKYGALRDAIGEINQETKKWEPKKPDPKELQTTYEPHDRGAILVAAVFDAFLTIYKSRVADLLRIATGGTGNLPEGDLHPDLVNRLATEAAKSADGVLQMCIRALDYCPPVDITFGDYLRALITADSDIVLDDDRGYRIAFIEAFRRRGIYPSDIRTLSVDSLRWPQADDESKRAFRPIAKKLRGFQELSRYITKRHDIFERTKKLRKDLHDFIRDELVAAAEAANEDDPARASLKHLQDITGLALTKERATAVGGIKTRFGKPIFEIHSVRTAQRVGPDGNLLNQLVISITQRKPLVPKSTQHSSQAEDSAANEEEDCDEPGLWFRGGCTLILDLASLEITYCIPKPIGDTERLHAQLKYHSDSLASSLRATYFGNPYDGNGEPFAVLHSQF